MKGGGRQWQFCFAFDFLQFSTVKSLKFFTICEIWSTNYLNTEKIGVREAVSSLILVLCFLPLPQIWSYKLFQLIGTRKGD